MSADLRVSVSEVIGTGSDARILARAGDCCEQCRAPNGVTIYAARTPGHSGRSRLAEPLRGNR